MNQPNNRAVSKRASEALMPCVPAGFMVPSAPCTDYKMADSASGSAAPPPDPAKGTEALVSETPARSTDPEQQADLKAIEAWENEGDPN
jgi:hypothetical protein